MSREVGFDGETGAYDRRLSEAEAAEVSAVDESVTESAERQRQRRDAFEAIAAKPDDEPVTAGELRAAGLVG